jgi:hypothetical protein
VPGVIKLGTLHGVSRCVLDGERAAGRLSGVDGTTAPRCRVIAVASRYMHHSLMRGRRVDIYVTCGHCRDTGKQLAA